MVKRHKSLLNIEVWKHMKISSFVQLPHEWKILGWGKEEKGIITKKKCRCSPCSYLASNNLRVYSVWRIDRHYTIKYYQ